MKGAFSRCHPVVNLIYFLFVMGVGMTMLHPAFLGMGFLGALVFFSMQKGKRRLHMLGYLALTMGFAAVLSPLFNHEGATVLGYFLGGNPLTAESIWNGAAGALMLGTTVLWFSCWNGVMTSDKVLYLFGRLWPAFSMVISTILRFFPCFMRRLNQVRLAWQDTKRKNLMGRIKDGLRQFSMMITWSMEHAVETGDVMRARGYGLPKRTSFSNFFWTLRDKLLLGAELLLGSVVLAGIVMGRFSFHFYPTVWMREITAETVCVLAAYGVFCLLPAWVGMMEELQWLQSKSKI